MKQSLIISINPVKWLVIYRKKTLIVEDISHAILHIITILNNTRV
jgi:hypothetical protein